MIESAVVEAGKCSWRESIGNVGVVIMGVCALSSLIMQGTKRKDWALRTILTPIFLLCGGMLLLVAAWAKGARFWLCLVIVVFSAAALVKRASRSRRAREDILAPANAQQDKPETQSRADNDGPASSSENRCRP
ncbi:MAG: hypothetical protein JW759_08840 [Candidatus Coatesbacteria bacterium]|nr:hypothetical protein [Candidatus Coatesbacteria bacterium]